MMVEREYIDIYFIKEEGDIINKYWIQDFYGLIQGGLML